jgi:hypothetical protein
VAVQNEDVADILKMIHADCIELFSRAWNLIATNIFLAPSRSSIHDGCGKALTATATPIGFEESARKNGMCCKLAHFDILLTAYSFRLNV